MTRWLGIALFHLLLAGSSACSKPEPPTIVPKEARVAAVSPTGLDIVVRVEATNPNTMTLTAQSFTGKAKLDGKYELATVTITKPVSLPPKTPTMIDVPMTMPWQDLNALLAMSSAQKPVPYVVDGTVTIGGESLNVAVPYTMSGTITKEQLSAAAMRSIPAIPGLVMPNKAPAHP
jgi:LEA14-like dessication related protein